MPTRRNWEGRTARLSADVVWPQRAPRGPRVPPKSTLPYEPVSDELLSQACMVYCKSRLKLLGTVPVTRETNKEYLRIMKRREQLDSLFIDEDEWRTLTYYYTMEFNTQFIDSCRVTARIPSTGPAFLNVGRDEV